MLREDSIHDSAWRLTSLSPNCLSGLMGRFGRYNTRGCERFASNVDVKAIERLYVHYLGLAKAP